MRELVTILAMICGLSCSAKNNEHVICTKTCEDQGGLVEVGRSDDYVQLLCTCADGSVEIGAVSPPR